MNDEQAHTSSNPDSVAPESDTGHTHHSKSATSGASSNDPSATPTQGSAPPLAMVDTGHVEENPKGDSGFRKTVSKPPKKRAPEWPSAPRRQGPLKLLDLPVDVLKEIVSEVCRCYPQMFSVCPNGVPSYRSRIRTISRLWLLPTRLSIALRYHTSTPDSTSYGPMLRRHPIQGLELTH